MPRAESSDAYLDRVMALAASQARAGRANHAAAANPLALRPLPSSEREVDRDHRASSSGGSRAVILRWLPGILLAAGLAWALTNAPAQPQPAKPKPAAAAPAKNAPAEAPKQQQQPAMPVSTEQALYLIRSTLLTLNDANRSGNYTVLRDLAAPDSRRATPPPTCRRFFPTCGGAISTSTPRRCWRHSSRRCRRWIKEDICT